MKASSKIDSIQAIRAFAAISVMLFHGTIMVNDKLDYLFLNNLFIVGFSGVDIFFVLSGFIILLTSNPSTKITHFLKRRFIRIYPIYWVVTLLLLIAFFISPSQEQSYKGDLKTVLGSFILFPQEKYVVGVAWTLTYELIFYIFFAVTYLRNPKLLFYSFSIWTTTILVFYFFNIKSGIYAIDTLTNPIILDFAFGCLVAYVYKKYSNLNYSKFFFWGGLGLFLITWLLGYQLKVQDNNAFKDDIAGIYYFGIPAALVIFGSLYLPWTIPRLFVYLGDASYSLYLIHGTVLSILIKILIKFNYEAIFATFVGTVILFLSTLITSCCFYSLVEKNLLFFINQIFLPSPIIATSKE